VNEEALARWGLSRQKQTNKQTNKKLSVFNEGAGTISLARSHTYYPTNTFVARRSSAVEI